MKKRKLLTKKKKKKKLNFLVHVIICEWSCKIVGKGLEEPLKKKKKPIRKEKTI